MFICPPGVEEFIKLQVKSPISPTLARTGGGGVGVVGQYIDI